MIHGSPFDAIHNAISNAITYDLPYVEYERRGVKGSRRPYMHEVEVIMFPQVWGSTALGYGGIGGSAMTTAYTVIINLDYQDYCVYFGTGDIAYKFNYANATPEGRENFFKDMNARNMFEVSKRGRYR